MPRPRVVRVQVIRDLEAPWGTLLSGSILCLTEDQVQTLMASQPGDFREIDREPVQTHRLMTFPPRTPPDGPPDSR